MPNIIWTLFTRRSAFPTLALALAAGSVVAGPAMAQRAYPDKPVRVIVGMPAGSFTDLSARLIGQSLGTELGSAFVVENRPGAATNIATQDVARAPKDGYTLLLSTNSNTMNVSLFKQLPFNIVRDFTPVAMITSSSFILVVNPKLPASNLKELIAYAKSHPDKVNFASTGSGTANDLAVRMLAQQAAVKVEIIFYKGSTDGILDVIAGRADAMFAPASSVMQQVAIGKLRAIAVTGATRTPLTPDIPTMAEAGLPGYEVSMWNGLFAPAGTPPETVNRLAAATTKAVEMPEIKSKIELNGGQPIVMGPTEFRAYVLKDISKWADAIKDAGIQPQ